MSQYPNLLSPLKIGNTILKNRMAMSQAVPVFISGVEETVPFDSMITWAGACAAAGASIVPLGAVAWTNPHSRPMRLPPRPPADDNDEMKIDDGLPTAPPGGGRKGVDFSTRNNQMRFARAAESVHNQGALACMGLSDVEPTGWDINDIPLAYLEELPGRFARAAVDCMAVGVDVGCIHMSYGFTLLCNSISPRNRRTDKYGGATIRDRATLSLEVFRRIKEVCPDFLLMVQVSGEETDGGYTLEDLCEYVKLCEGIVDIFQIRGATNSASHPTGVNSEKHSPVTLRYAEALKKTGTSAIIAPVGGYHDPDLIEQWLAEGKFDMVFMARAFIAEPNYEKKLRKGQEIIPCLRCNKCHCRPGDPEFGCAANPMIALALDPCMERILDDKPEAKKVAVIGGGPAGMQAAIVAAERGHSVTLYEKASKLGGQLLHADFSEFKWPLRDFKNYLIRKLKASDVNLVLNTTVTPELLKAEGFEAVLLAAGATEQLPPIPGVEETAVWKPQEIYGKEDQLGKNVVVIGGGDTGTETAWYLALHGHSVTLVSRRRPEPFDDDTEEYRSLLERNQSEGSLTKLLSRKTVRIQDGCVTVEDRKGIRESLPCDSIVACGGMRAEQQDLMEFANVGTYFRVIGDCAKPRDVRMAMKTASAAALIIG